MGGINFGWLVVWDLCPYWLSRKLVVCDFCHGLGEAASSGEGCDSTLHRIPWHLPNKLGKSRKNLSQGNRKALGSADTGQPAHDALGFASAKGVEPRSAKLSAELPC
jgi:hypothetical protein